MQKKHRIAIIGTGTSGLAAAVRLLEHPRADAYEVTIFESRLVPGGRTRSFVDAETGDTLDNGQHLLMGCYAATSQYLTSIGSDGSIETRAVNIPYSLFNPFTGSSREARFRVNMLLPAPLHALYGLLRTDLLSVNQKLEAITLCLKIKRMLGDGWTESASQTCAEFFRQQKQSAGTIQKLWEPLVVGTINANINEASVEPLLAVLRLALLGKKSGATFLFPTVGLSELLIDPAIRFAEAHGASIELGKTLSAVTTQEHSIGLRFTDGVHRVFDSVILASQLNKIILPPGITVHEPTYSPIVNAYFWVDQPLLREPIKAYIGTTLQWAFSKPSVFAAERIALTVSAAGELVEMDNQEIERQLWLELRRAESHIGGGPVRLIHSKIIRERQATPLFTPVSAPLRPRSQTVIPGLFLAGDLVQNGLPATIEGAIVNGNYAAELAISRLEAAP